MIGELVRFIIRFFSEVRSIRVRTRVAAFDGALLAALTFWWPVISNAIWDIFKAIGNQGSIPWQALGVLSLTIVMTALWLTVRSGQSFQPKVTFLLAIGIPLAILAVWFFYGQGSKTEPPRIVILVPSATPPSLPGPAVPPPTSIFVPTVHLTALAVATVPTASVVPTNAPGKCAPNMFYTMLEYDTLMALGDRCNVKWQDIAAANGIVNTRAIPKGKVIVIPRLVPSDTGGTSVEASDALRQLEKINKAMSDYVVLASPVNRERLLALMTPDMFAQMDNWKTSFVHKNGMPACANFRYMYSDAQFQQFGTLVKISDREAWDYVYTAPGNSFIPEEYLVLYTFAPVSGKLILTGMEWHQDPTAKGSNSEPRCN